MDLPPETLRRAQRGESAAQMEFLRAAGGPLRSLVRRLGPSDSDDALQDLYAKLIEVLPRFDPRGPAQLSTWVFTVAHRWVLERHRKRRLTLVPLEDGLHVADQRPGPEEELHRRSVRDQLEAAIAQLPADQRRVLVLAQIHGQPLDAIAAEEGIPLGTVKSRLHRARAAMAAILGDTLDDEEGGSRAIP